MAKEVIPQVFLHEGHPVQGWRDDNCFYLSFLEMEWALDRAHIDYAQGSTKFMVDKYILAAERHTFGDLDFDLYPILIFTRLNLTQTERQYLIEDNPREIAWDADNTGEVWTSLISTPFWLEGRVTREGDIVSIFLCGIDDTGLVEVFGPDDQELFYFLGDAQ